MVSAAMRESHIASLLLAAVPLRMMALAAKGGPDSDDWKAASTYAETLAKDGDDLLFGGPDAQRATNDLTRAIALLSFTPGGVTIFGLHFEAGAEPPVYGRAVE